MGMSTIVILYAVRPSSMVDPAERARAALREVPGFDAAEADSLLAEFGSCTWPIAVDLPDRLAGSAVEVRLRDAFLTEADTPLAVAEIRRRVAFRKAHTADRTELAS